MVYRDGMEGLAAKQGGKSACCAAVVVAVALGGTTQKVPSVAGDPTVLGGLRFCFNQ